MALSAVKLLSPTAPSKIVAVGPNYHAHMTGGRQAPPRPFYWLKPASAVINPDETIRIPADAPSTCHESELAIVIGKKASRVSVADAKNYIIGYTCVNDVTGGMMDQPEKHMASQWAVDGKIFDTVSRQIEPFNKKGVPLTETTSFAGDLEWDSLTVMDFVAAIEDEFDITITMNMQAEIETVGQLVDAVAKLKG